GTSSTKSTIFDVQGSPIAKGQVDLATLFLDDGFAEQDPEAIYSNVLASVANCLDDFLKGGGEADQISTVGISNQRETFVIWDETGVPLHNAVVWQCKRSIAICNRLISQDLKNTIKAKTGLMIDPYFSGTKLIWLYENSEKVRTAVDAGKAYFGTVDTWLLFKLTKGKSYLTDHTNASRTLFFNLKTLRWDKALLSLFGLSKLNLPEIKPSSYHFGESDFDGLLRHPLPIHAMIGDSHAAAFGEGCFEKGQAKATLGTGCSIMMNAGSELPVAAEGIVGTICYSTPTRVDYALEGVIVSCGSTIEWLRREMGLFNHPSETEAMATSVADNNGVFLIPAFSGLGAPYWDMNRKGELKGLTFESTKNHIVRAGLESIAYQIRDVTDAMKSDGAIALQSLVVNGGIISNKFVQMLLVNLVSKSLAFGSKDASGLGAAYLAGLGAGLYRDIDEIKAKLKEKTYVERISPNVNLQENYLQWLTYLNYGK
ncbi:MAG: glycerol kinase GlpK, partial [Chitinophagaceae bacterium]